MAKGEVSNHASALGEAVGGILDDEVFGIVKSISESLGFVVKSSGRGTKLILVDTDGNDYAIDIGIFDKPLDTPVVIVETKFLRYKKHMRDKGSWITKSHYSLRRSYPSIRMCLSVLGGDWTKGAKNLLKSSGEKIIEIPLSHVISAFGKEGVNLEWSETDRVAPKIAWEAFQKLTHNQKQKIGTDLLSIHKNDIITIVKSTLTQDMSIVKIKRIELAIELENGRSLVYRFPSEVEFKKFFKNFDPKKIK